jgi:hypothetical protein
MPYNLHLRGRHFTYTIHLLYEPGWHTLCTQSHERKDLCKYCDGFAQGITGRQPGGHVLAHAPCNDTVEVSFVSAYGPVLHNACAGDVRQQ